MEEAPEKVSEFASALVLAVEKSVGVRLDYSPETLPVLDLYRRRFSETVGTMDADGVTWKPEFLGLVAPMVACYFGEVVRRNLDARWSLPAAEMNTWRIEFNRCFLFFNPLGLAVESFIERQVEGVPGAYQVSRGQRDSIREVLESQPEVLDRDFYSFTVRWEILELIVEHLMQDRLLRGEAPDLVTEESYALEIEADMSDMEES